MIFSENRLPLFPICAGHVMPLYRDGLKHILTYEPCASLAGTSGDWSEG